MIGALKKVLRPFMPKRKVWKLKDATRVGFEDEFHRVAHAVGQITNVKDLWKSTKDNLLGSSAATCGWTREPPRHRVI